jgi:hypothetical protein
MLVSSRARLTNTRKHIDIRQMRAIAPRLECGRVHAPDEQARRSRAGLKMNSPERRLSLRIVRHGPLRTLPYGALRRFRVSAPKEKEGLSL